eukprot:TRINITY_DN3227_c0_g1_i2.p1 TRINITY_DN3227_c0_g1~~TRINITY_DN3227_c0_g1_i2.p1  ORF type:complete len:391 (-),score=62.04 TRINITY_DN3227_c0_g1_i2:319-1434(-)
MSPWSDWSDCSKSCAGGTQKATRKIEVKHQHGGKACPTDLSKSQDCNKHPCPIDCKMSPWSAWSKCTSTCGGGKQKATRKVLVNGQHGGKKCPTVLYGPSAGVAFQACNKNPCPVHCKMSPWSSWGTCTKTCGGGIQKATRKVLVNAQHGAPACPTDLVKSQGCNKDSCPIDCKMSPWSDWSDCSKSCAGGTQKATRKIEVKHQHGGKACPTDLSKSQDCNKSPCPVDCKMSPWTDWGKCSKTCGGGMQIKTRSTEVKPLQGGKPCPKDFSAQQTCNSQQCPIDCKMSAWGKWTTCSKPCGGGTQKVKRSIEVQPQHGGVPCPSDLVKSVECNTSPCKDESTNSTQSADDSPAADDKAAEGAGASSLNKLK